MLEYVFHQRALSKIRKVIKEAESIHLFLDYDGTITPFTDNPEETYPSKKAVNILKSLVSIPQVQIAIISGRQLSKLRELLKLEEVTYAGAHGLQIEYPTGEKFVWDKAEDNKTVIEQIKNKLSGAFTNFDGVFLEDKEFTLGLHYRKYDGDPQVIVKKFKQQVGDHLDGLQMLCGDKILEVRPKGWHKGKAVELIKKKFVENFPEGGKALPIYIGDDRTDEDAFQYLKEGPGLTVLVLNEKAKTEPTQAKYYCQDPKEVLRFLDQIHKWQIAD